MAYLAGALVVGVLLYALWKLTVQPLVRYGGFLRRIAWSAWALFPPPIGHTFQIPHDSEAILDTFRRWLDQSGNGMAYAWLGYEPILLVTNADIVEQVLKNPRFNTKGLMYSFLFPWLHTGLLTSTGDKWKSRRRLLTPAFHFAILKSYFTTMREQVDTLLQVIRERSGGGKTAVDARELITNCTLDVICETAMGVHPDAQRSSKNNPYVSAVKHSNELLINRMAHPYLWPDFLYGLMPAGRELARHLKVLHEYTRRTIIERQQALEQSPPAWLSHLHNDGEDSDGEERERIEGKLPLLDLLIATSIYAPDGTRAIDFAGIQEEVDTFMFEGHDTTANALIWTLQRVAEDPEVQAKVHAELDHVFGRSDRPIDFEDLAKLSYLEAVIKEVLRLYPPVPMLQRTTDAEGTVLTVDGETLAVPRGLHITVIPYLLHRDPAHFPNPDAFDPGRFTRETLNSESGAARHPYAYVPFSAGPRNCIGQKFALMEEKTLLAQLLRRYRIVAEQTAEQVGIKPDLILRQRNPVMIKFIARL